MTEKALRNARIHPSEVDYINAHGSATPLNDPIETRAIKTVFPRTMRYQYQLANAPITGHLMGSFQRLNVCMKLGNLAPGSSADDQSGGAGREVQDSGLYPS